MAAKPVPVVLLSVVFTGTHFMRRMLELIEVKYQNFHPAHGGGWGPDNPGSPIPDGVKVAPLRDPLLAWISYIQRSGNLDWKRMLERSHRVGFTPFMGLNGSVAAWKWLFSQDIAAFVRLDGTATEHLVDLRELVRVTRIESTLDLDYYAAHWPKLASSGDGHELKRAYLVQDRSVLELLIEQVKPVSAEFRARGCRLWWDDASS